MLTAERICGAQDRCGPVISIPAAKGLVDQKARARFVRPRPYITCDTYIYSHDMQKVGGVFL